MLRCSSVQPVGGAAGPAAPGTMHFVTQYAVILHAGLSDEAAQIICDKLTEGGLILTKQVPTEKCPETVLHVGCARSRLQLLAEELEMRKEDREGYIRPVTEQDWDQFPESGKVGPLHISDIHRCVQFAMEKIYFDTSVEKLPGHEDLSVMAGAPMLSSYQEAGLLTTFPLHDYEELERLEASWTRARILAPPLDLIRNYFGENVALYWSFAETYTWLLVIMAVLGAVQWVLTKVDINHLCINVAFTFLNLIILAFFCEFWKRKSREHSFFWGTSGHLRLKRPRPEYRGELRRHPVTGNLERYYSSWERKKKIAFVSFPVTLIYLILASAFIVLKFEAEKFIEDNSFSIRIATSDLMFKIVMKLPSIGYSLLNVILFKIYLILGKVLTDWENHRTEEQYNFHITMKLVSFEFFKIFLAMFYICFWLGDLGPIKAQLVTDLVVAQALDHGQEWLLPWLLQTRVVTSSLQRIRAQLAATEAPQQRSITGVADIASEDERTAQFNRNNLQSVALNDSLHSDYMELWRQFARVSLFSSISPLSAVIAMISVVTELFADRHKFLHLSRKPVPVALRDIGGWYLAFYLTSVISIISNCALIAMDLRDTAGAGWTDAEWILLFITIEHVFLAIFFGIDPLVPDTSARVKRAMDTTDYYFKQIVVRIRGL